MEQPRYVVLVTPRNGAVALYRYTPEIANDIVWHRVVFASVHDGYDQRTRDLMVDAFRKHDDRIIEVDSDIHLAQRISPKAMEELLT